MGIHRWRRVLHRLFTKGQHAFNMGTRSKLTTIKNWPQRLADWMGDNNLLNPAVPAKNAK